MPLHRQTVNLVLLLTNGKMIKKAGLTDYTVSKNGLFLLPQGHITDTTLFTENIDGYFVHFSNNFLISKSIDLEHWINAPSIKTTTEETNILLNLLIRMEEIQSTTQQSGLLKSYLHTFLAEITALQNYSVKIATTSREKIVQLYNQLLLEFNTKEHAVSFYAEKLNITPNHLNKCVKLVLNKSASALLNEMIILEAKVLMNQNPINVGELAFALGFEDPSYFARFFKKHTDITPTEYYSKIDLS